jgi:hypothetical protein
MTNYRVGNHIQHNGQPHCITSIDYFAKAVTLRPVDDSKPIGQRWGDAVDIPLSKLPLK